MGLHHNFKHQLSDLVRTRVLFCSWLTVFTLILPLQTEIVCADLDNGSVFVPDGVSVPPLPEPYSSRLLTGLTLVLARTTFEQPAANISLLCRCSTRSCTRPTWPSELVRLETICRRVSRFVRNSSAGPHRPPRTAVIPG